MTAGIAKTKGVKPSTVGMACPFFGAGTSESTGDSVISSIMIKVEGAEGILISAFASIHPNPSLILLI